MKPTKTVLGTLWVIGATLTSGCVAGGGYVQTVTPTFVPTTTVITPMPAVVVPVRPWYHAPRFQGHGHHHRHGHHR